MAAIEIRRRPSKIAGKGDARRKQRRAKGDRSLRRQAGAVRPPSGLEAHTFEVLGDEYAVFTFAIPEVEPPSGLSAAEREVTRAVVDGQSNKEIAFRRNTSPYTVANQLRSIYAKLGVSNRLELIARCGSK
jgi:DNA-binding CsgD family transcriptional regulator